MKQEIFIKNHAFTRVLCNSIWAWNFKTQSETIIEALQLKPDTYFDLIELGAGDGLKPKNFWENQGNYRLDYMPVDIFKML
jgi:hypothetical protein